LYRIREKQDEAILKILRGELEYLNLDLSEAIFNFLNNEEVLKKIGTQLYKTKKINQPTPIFDLSYNIDMIIDSIDNNQIIIEKFFPEEKILEKNIPKEYRYNKQFKSTLNQMYKLLKKKKKLPLLETILSDSYTESFLKIQCLSFLFTNSYINLVKSSDSERDRSGRWIIWDSTNNPQKNDGEKTPASIIIGLSYKNWKIMQPFFEKDDFKGRPHLPTID
jgi:hypothetical protein